MKIKHSPKISHDLKNGIFKITYPIALFLLFFAASCSGLKQKRAISEYKQTAQNIIQKAKAGGDSQELASLGWQLINKAKPILDRIRKKNPACRNILDIILERSQEMTQLDLASIERNYHQGAALPKSDENCYEAKELIVHPATVIVLATRHDNPAGKQKIVEELEEVLAHIDMLL